MLVRMKAVSTVCNHHIVRSMPYRSVFQHVKVLFFLVSLRWVYLPNRVGSTKIAKRSLYRVIDASPRRAELAGIKSPITALSILHYSLHRYARNHKGIFFGSREHQHPPMPHQPQWTHQSDQATLAATCRSKWHTDCTFSRSPFTWTCSEASGEIRRNGTSIGRQDLS